MTFTDGKDRFYENLMRGVPNFAGRGAGHMKFKYNFYDIDCRYCDEYKSCEHELCPHIMENLDDLTADKDFLAAVENAETCKSAQKRTLLYIKDRQSCE